MKNKLAEKKVRVLPFSWKSSRYSKKQKHEKDFVDIWHLLPSISGSTSYLGMGGVTWGTRYRDVLWIIRISEVLWIGIQNSGQICSVYESSRLLLKVPHAPLEHTTMRTPVHMSTTESPPSTPSPRRSRPTRARSSCAFLLEQRFFFTK